MGQDIDQGSYSLGWDLNLQHAKYETGVKSILQKHLLSYSYTSTVSYVYFTQKHWLWCWNYNSGGTCKSSIQTQLYKHIQSYGKAMCLVAVYLWILQCNKYIQTNNNGNITQNHRITCFLNAQLFIGTDMIFD